MITVFLGGGLGNQLFQFAVARSLAERHRTKVRLDLYGYRKALPNFNDPEGRPFALDRFALSETVIAGAVYARLTRHRRRIANPRLRRLAMPNLFKEKTDGYDSDFERLPNGTYLWGFFQSHRYFSNVAARLHSDFAPKDPSLLPRIETELGHFRRNGRALVALHVRRGDYLRFDGLVMTAQQRQATMDQFHDADFLVFSDDMAWCRTNIQGSNIFYSPFTNMLDDFFAMSRCDHNVIAKNSTFSWWAAWLNPSPGRIVVAPSWNDPKNFDLYPKDWRVV